MRKYIAPAIVLLAVIILLGISLYRSPEKQISSPPTPRDNPSATASATPTPQPGVVRKQLPGGPYEPSDPRWAEVHEKDKMDKHWEWKMPINFYGKVVDQNGQPVSGAKVQLSWTDQSKEGSTQSETSSDGQGNFTLENKEGRYLLVTVTKPGYYTAQQQNQTSFDYAGFWDERYYQPDSRNPVLFHLRKEGVKENLLTGNINVNIPSGGAPTSIGFSRNPADSWARVEVQAWTNTEKYPPRIFDWHAIITVPGGDIQPCNDEFPFTAPEGDYKPSIEFNMPATAEKWKRGIEQQYYIRYTNPLRYGRVLLEISGASQNVSGAYWINPTPGSRNLEFDPSKR
jgi:protocatechuate 3,4-dioxygenase beta subunit